MDAARSYRTRPGFLPVLRELRAPLVALAVVCLVFHAAVPLAASASPQVLAGISTCLGEPDEGSGAPGKSPVHSALCICGQICGHAGLTKPAEDGAAVLPAPERGVSGRFPYDSHRAIGRAACPRPPGRAPPTFS